MWAQSKLETKCNLSYTFSLSIRGTACPHNHKPLGLARPRAWPCSWGNHMEPSPSKIPTTHAYLGFLSLTNVIPTSPSHPANLPTTTHQHTPNRERTKRKIKISITRVSTPSRSGTPRFTTLSIKHNYPIYAARWLQGRKVLTLHLAGLAVNRSYLGIRPSLLLPYRADPTPRVCGAFGADTSQAAPVMLDFMLTFVELTHTSHAPYSGRLVL